MAKQFRVASALKWRSPDNKAVYVEYNEGQKTAYVPSQDMSPAGLRSLAAALLDAAEHVEECIGDQAEPRIEPTAPTREQYEAVQRRAPSTALAAVAVQPRRVEAEETEEAEDGIGDDFEDDKGNVAVAPVAPRTKPRRAPEGTRPGFPPRPPRGGFESGGYISRDDKMN